MNADNPINERLERLQLQWREFSDAPKAKVLRWLFRPDEESMLQAFLETENDDQGVTDALFLRLQDGFANAQVHGFALAKALEDTFKDAPQPEDDGEGPFPGLWECPRRTSQDQGNAYLRKCLASFCEHYQSHLVQLVLVLTPTRISVAKIYLEWLAGFVQGELPPQVRIVIPDHPEPHYAGLDKMVAPGLVWVRTANLDMSGALGEIAENGEDAGGLFRKHYVAVTDQVGKKNMPQAEVHARQALAITAEHDLPHLEPAIHLTMGAGFLGLKDHQPALASYRASQASSRRAMSKQEPGAPKLLVQSIFGECSVLMMCKGFALAAPLYREAAKVAEADKDPQAALESHRMAAYCYAHQSQWDDAFGAGMRQLELAEAMEPGELPQTGFRYGARDLSKLVRKWRFDSRQRDQVDARLDKLLGPGWKDKLEKEHSA